MGCGESKHAVVENTLTKSISRSKKPVEKGTADAALLKEENKREKIDEREKAEAEAEVVEERKDETKKEEEVVKVDREEGKGNEGKEEDLKADESKELASNEESKPSAEEKTVSDKKEEAIDAAPV